MTQVALIVGGIGTLFLLYYFFLKFFFRTPDPYTRVLELHRAGGTIRCFVYEPSLRTDKRPVILTHGISANHRFFNVHEDMSLIAALTKAGYTVYAPDQRGFGASRKGQRNSVSIRDLTDDCAFLIHAVIRDYYTDQKTKKKLKVHWVGHSLGALVMALAFKARPKLRKKVKTFVNISGPITPPSSEHPGFSQFHRLPSLAKWFPLRLMSVLVIPFVSRFQTGYDAMVYSTNVVSLKLIRRILANVVSDTPAELIRDFEAWIQTRRVPGFSPEDLKTLPEGIPCKTLFITGRIDQLCDPWPFALDFQKVSYKGFKKKRKKKLVIVSRKSGFRQDVCHTGIINSETARAEIYPLIADFLE